MKIVIIEDEELTANDLAETILKVEPNTEIISILKSVKEAQAFFKKSDINPDLIFSDIQLGDGLSFEIFNSVQHSFPVIFCTAYDEYALNAFKANGIDYILKPFNKKSINDALLKYKNLKDNFSKDNTQYENIIKLFESQKNNKSGSVLVYQKDKIVPVKIEAIALFYIENEITYLITLDNTKYVINKTLEELEKITSDNYFRANRQYLINRKAVKDASQYFARKLSVSLTIPFKESITISREKTTEFLNWLSAN
ncbi:MAG: DNA-binding response regulator [Bacteroidetes bacterium GWF2_38_335]|nr:MAG: DNA-binding response regulator [Bacteroidetes bacterium GWF2_38_335]OFY77604.1 MAG: DNA-binding response regulator [Bacteroidetes bacterium RIFOXYA12_FULL_38_20]HBS87094.1 DNA-binding response regulator [Bacteroidales bacterium]